ncbi:MAG: threonine--tRNA ligase, partial [Oscillatoriales cyanobacterium RU_3_3]|nr:threonine--tRNA ligase [Oscillatoriales cyanobacterium RU_3_3]
AREAVAKMKLLNIRAEVDESNERLGKLIRNAEKDKIPVMGVVGAKEVEANSLNIRTRASGELGAILVGEVIERLQGAISSYGNF